MELQIHKYLIGVKTGPGGDIFTFHRLMLLYTLILVIQNIRLTHGTVQQNKLPTADENKFNVATEEQCRRYLCKYGYLDCNCMESSETEANRKKRDLFSFRTMIPVEFNDDKLKKAVTLPTKLTTPKSQTCTEDHYKGAYKEFQEVYGLKETGRCDAATKKYMSKRRCGQPDIFDMDKVQQNEPSSNAGSTNDDDRRKRSPVTLYSVISKETKRAAAIERRKQIMSEFLSQQEKKHITYNGGSSVRKPRSILNVQINDYGGLMTKKRISWRLMSSHMSASIPPNTQNAILMHAFRYWSEVSPLCFQERKLAPKVDIEIGFLEGVHLNCFKQFDGFGGEIAHKFIRDVHFDKTEPYTSEATSENSISLLLVAVHEIGHVLGFNHSTIPGSIMNAIYHRNIKGDFELSDYDRLEVRKAYGACKGKFDLVFDFVTSVGSSRIFNTYFFRGNNFWLYENKNRRARFGDPLKINAAWNNLPANLDAYLHYFEQDPTAKNGIKDEYYFFQGDSYYKYDQATGVTNQGLIRDKFSSGAHGTVPNNLDAVFYEFLTKKIFFFKGEKVWQYAYNPSGNHSCCTEPPKKIVDLFPPKSPAHLTSPTGESYASDVDAVYFSWTQPFPLYLIKGNSAWLIEGYSVYGPYKEENLRAKYAGPWNEIWNYICDVECPA